VKERIGIIKTKNVKKGGRAEAWSAENSALGARCVEYASVVLDA